MRTIHAVRGIGCLLVVVLMVMGVLALVYGPLQEVPARFLIVEDRLEPADAIVVLSGGRGDERVRQAAELYRAGYAPLVILSAPSSEDIVGLTFSEVLRREALGHRIPESALLFETESTSTSDEARNLRPMLEGRRARRAIIVTSSYHTRRTRHLFRKFFAGSPVEVRIYPVQQEAFNPAGWWTRHRDRQAVVLEYVKLVGEVARYR